MKITIDTKSKQVTLNEEVSFKELMETVMVMLPEDWENYTVTAPNSIELPGWDWPSWPSDISDGSDNFLKGE